MISTIWFPNESGECRAARDALTQAETEPTRRIDVLASRRRQLPPGGEVPHDYVFTEALPRGVLMGRRRAIRLP